MLGNGEDHSMQPKITLLSDQIINRVLDEAFQLLVKPGIKVRNEEARSLLSEAGAHVNEGTEVVNIPETLVRTALETVPPAFYLYDLHGNPVVAYGGDKVHFDPGSSGVTVLDPDTLEHKSAETADLIRLIMVAEQLDQLDAQSTAVVCNEVPKEIQDLYRLFIVLTYSKKPIVTGAFTSKTVGSMIEMLTILSGSSKALREMPRAVFDVCPNPPLIWSDFGCKGLITLAHAGVPVEIVSMPLAGAAAPVTILGTVTQHAAECLAGIVIHQMAQPGAPIVWGGAPAIFDMRKGSAPMGAIETAMIDSSYAQVGKSLNLPTHAYLGATDSKLVDAQAGLESGINALIGALSGINMISGSGMLDFLVCQSAEKLVIDAEGIAMARRFIEGVKVLTEPLATGFFEPFDFKGDFLKQKITRELFSKEQYLPTPVIDRNSAGSWKDAGSLDTFSRAKIRVNELIKSYRRPEMDLSLIEALESMVTNLARTVGMDKLPVDITFPEIM